MSIFHLRTDVCLLLIGHQIDLIHSAPDHRMVVNLVSVDQLNDFASRPHTLNVVSIGLDYNFDPSRFDLREDVGLVPIGRKLYLIQSALLPESDINWTEVE